MHQKFYSFILLLVFLGVAVSPVRASESDSDYSWPVAEPTHLTSTFGEYRGDHLHNGIDFSTTSSKSEYVFAVDTGIVERVFYDPDKYGKTIIIRHNDGRKSWYSHLDSISDTLLDSMQGTLSPNQSWRADTSIEVSNGEKIGLAGETGRGLEHLHFALQNESQEFINPLGMFEPKITFNAKPHLESIFVFPLDGHSWINGKANRIRLNDLPRDRMALWGKIGFDFQLWNKHSVGGNRSVPRTVRMRVNGRLVKELDFSQLSAYEIDTGVTEIYNHRFSNITPTRYTFHMTPGSDSGTWTGLHVTETGETGVVEIEIVQHGGDSNSYKFAYEAVPPPVSFDWLDNRVAGKGFIASSDKQHLKSIRPARANFMVASLEKRQTATRQYSPPDFETSSTIDPNPSLEYKWESNRVKITLNIKNRWSGWPTMHVLADDYADSVKLIQTTPGRFVGWWKPDENRDGWHTIEARVKGKNGYATTNKRIYLQSIRAFRPGAAISSDGRYSLFYPGEGLKFSTFTVFKKLNKFQSPRDELRVFGTPRKIVPGSMKSETPLKLTAELPKDLDKLHQLGLYVYNSITNRWNVLSYKRGLTPGVIKASLSSSRTIALMRDSRKPSIRFAERDGNRYIWSVEENGSGITRDRIRVSRDSESVSFRWNFDRGRIEVPVENPDSLSADALKITIYDRAGNESVWQGSVSSNS